MATPPPATPPTPKEESRRFPRCNMALDAAYGPVANAQARPQTNQLTQTVTVNIGPVGMCLFSPRTYPIDSTLFCAITLPGRVEPITTMGRVTWFKRVNQTSPGYRLGIKFGAFSAEDSGALEALFANPPDAEASRAKKLLLVEDDLGLRRALRLRFESKGFHVVVASDGLDALRKGREEHPHAIIMDIMLPNLSGYEVCQLLKFDQRFKHIPILLCTARCGKEDMEMGRAVGADAYVTKPFNGEELITKVKELINVTCG